MGIERLTEFWPEWKVTGVLGSGSYGKVYKAEYNDGGVITHSAIKVISVPASDAEAEALISEGFSEDDTKHIFETAVKDFLGEIKVMATLKGAPNIVIVDTYKTVEKKNGVGSEIFIRMELLKPFKEYINGKALSEKEIIKLGIDIATALETCQNKNIIHRDIKPANIFIDDFGNFKLGDFGIAKELEKTRSALSAKGTASYMAPEVARGVKYDSTVDIYSLGLVLYTLLNNNLPPFAPPSSSNLSFNERYAYNEKRLSGEKMPPPKNASRELASIILTACSFEPSKRFKTASALKMRLYHTEIISLRLK